MSFHGRFNQGNPNQPAHLSNKSNQSFHVNNVSNERVYLRDLQPGPAKNVSLHHLTILVQG